MRTIEARVLDFRSRTINEAVCIDNSAYEKLYPRSTEYRIQAELISPKRMRRLPAVPIRLKLHRGNEIITVKRAWINTLDGNTFIAHWSD